MSGALNNLKVNSNDMHYWTRLRLFSNKFLRSILVNSDNLCPVSYEKSFLWKRTQCRVLPPLVYLNKKTAQYWKNKPFQTRYLSSYVRFVLVDHNTCDCSNLKSYHSRSYLSGIDRTSLAGLRLCAWLVLWVLFTSPPPLSVVWTWKHAAELICSSSRQFWAD